MLKYHKAEDTCRQCKHAFTHHFLYMPIWQGGMQQPFVQPVDQVPCDSYANSSSSTIYPGKCACLNWEPTDNLEYLELKSKETDEKTND